MGLDAVAPAVVGFDSLRAGSRSRNDVRDEWLRAADAAAGPEECELCRAAAATGVEYGLRVCGDCDRELLP